MARRVPLASVSAIVLLLLGGGAVSAQPVPACPPAPRLGCRAASVAGKGSLDVRAGTKPAVTWQWKEGDQGPLSELGSPASTTGYRFCLYEESAGTPSLVLSAGVAGGGTCGAHLCWKPSGKGYRYKDSAAATEGVSEITIKPDDSKPKSKATVRLKGSGFAVPVLPLAQDGLVVAQLVNGVGTCWEGRFAAPAKTATANRFEDRVEAEPSRFGVHVSQGSRPGTATDARAAGAGWVRVNATLGSPLPDLAGFLAAGLNVVVTVVNRDPTNVDTTNGDLASYPNAGFPYLDASVYAGRLHDLLTPALPALGTGRRLWVQCENEIGDPTLSPLIDSRYWRGSTDDYLATLTTLADTVHALSPKIGVVVSSFTNEALERVIVPLAPGDPGYANYAYASTLLGRLLGEGDYDAADLHFYGCTETIAAKVGWVAARLPAGRHWISTENGGPDSVGCVSAPDWQDGIALYELAQSAEVTTRLETCANLGGSVCLWFSLYDLVNEDDRFNHMGLIDPRGVPPRRRSAFEAFSEFTTTHH